VEKKKKKESNNVKRSALKIKNAQNSFNTGFWFFAFPYGLLLAPECTTKSTHTHTHTHTDIVYTCTNTHITNTSIKCTLPSRKCKKEENYEYFSYARPI